MTRVGNGGLGGKTVWQRTDDGLSIYYAHLDEQLVSPGDYVEKGTPIGTVGNTGNARTTPPHLHFGIYKNRGAVDPLHYYQLNEKEPKDPLLDQDRLAKLWKVDDSEPYFLRPEPDKEADPMRQLSVGEQVWVTGISANLYRIRTQIGETGYFVP